MGTIEAKLSTLSGIVLLTLLLLVSGCTSFFGSEPDPTPIPITGESAEFPLQGRGVLACNQACADQAQCGSNVELGQVVLLSSVEPRLDNHDLLAGHNFGVDIRESRDVEVIRPGAPNTQFMRFYKVSIRSGELDRGEAWVAGWCIQATTN